MGRRHWTLCQAPEGGRDRGRPQILRSGPRALPPLCAGGRAGQGGAQPRRGAAEGTSGRISGRGGRDGGGRALFLGDQGPSPGLSGARERWNRSQCWYLL